MTDEAYARAVSFWDRKDAGERKLDADRLSAWIDGFLGSHRVLALATGGGDTIRCTPLEYHWDQGALWVFTEGGRKLCGIRDDRRVAAAVFDAGTAFGSLRSAQIEGEAFVLGPEDEAYGRAAALRHLPIATLQGLAEPLWLLKIVPKEIQCLDSSFRKEGYGSRQLWRA